MSTEADWLDELLNEAGVEVGFSVKRVRLIGFRGYRDTELNFSSRTTVIIGGNGVGKTSLLESIRLSLSWLAARVVNVKGRGERISQGDIHAEMDIAAVELFTSYRLENPSRGSSHNWTIATARKGSGASIKNLQELAALSETAKAYYFSNEEKAQGLTPLPVFAYYGVGRSITDVPRRIRTRHKYARLDTYEGALTDGKADFRRFFEWFREREDEENEKVKRVDRDYVDRGLEATRQAISALMPGYSKPYIRRAGNEMILEKDGAELSVAQLSDGERTLITMVADLGRRLAMATENTSLHEEPLKGHGIALIDEVELHLHPGLQQKVIQRLEQTFPNLQFIVTTHSPLVLTTLPRESIRILHSIKTLESPYPERIITQPSTQSEGVSADEILRAVMDIDPEPELPINQDAEHFEILVQAGELNSERVQALEEKLKKHYGEASQTFQSLISTKRLYERRERIKAMRGE